MNRAVVDRELRRFVVRIVDPATGRTFGSGVLVAPGWVLTCAHVVRDAETVTVLPDPLAANGGVAAPAQVPGVIRARSALPPAGSGTGFWPYPDLALVELDGWQDHVCAPLGAEPPSGQSRPHAWGFGRREADVPAVGSPASFDYVGEDNDGYLQLQAGEAPPGLSGAPLICPTNRSVVALMSVARAVDSARGGWASPVRAMTEQAAGSEWEKLGPTLWKENQRDSWRYRDAWARVVTEAGAGDLVDRLWLNNDSVDLSAGQPSLMLRAEFGVVPYLERNSELATVESWCSTPDRVSIAYIDASGGSGKTRFAIESCQRMTDRGWVAGFLPRIDRGATTLGLPRLLVVDYVEEHDTPLLKQQLDAMVRSATALSPVRLLLLSRPPVGSPLGHVIDALREEAAGAALVALDNAQDFAGAVGGLMRDQSEQLYESALDRFGHARFGASWSAPNSPLPEFDEPSRPLDVLFEAFDRVLSSVDGDEQAAVSLPTVDRALDHEQRHWKTRLPTIATSMVARCVALATLFGAEDSDEVSALFDLLPNLPAGAKRNVLEEAVARLYDGPARWNPLRPDRLGEALIRRELLAEPSASTELLIQAFILLSDSQVARSLTVLTRLAHSDLSATIATSALVRGHLFLASRCRAQPDSVTEQRALIRLMDSLARASAALLTVDYVQALDSQAQMMLSLTSDQIGTLARDYGRSRDAYAVLEVALAADQALANASPDDRDYRRNVGLAHQRLGDLDRNSGRVAGARAHFAAYLDVAQAMVDLEPDDLILRRDLGLAHQRLGDLDRNSGRLADARAHIAAYLEVAQAMVDLDPDNSGYRQSLGLAHQQLGDLDLVGGRASEAAAHFAAYLEAAAALVDLNPSDRIYRHSLGLAHQRVGDLDSENGRVAEAAVHFAAYLEAAAALVDLDPDNPGYRHSLGLAHQRLGDLDRAGGRAAEAAAHFAAYLEAAEALINTDAGNPSYRQLQGVAHQRLGDLDRDAQRTANARAHYVAYLSAAQALIDVNPDNPGYRRDLGLAHQRLGDLDKAEGKLAEANAHYAAYLDATEVLISIDPNNPTYRRMLKVANRLNGISE